MSMYEKRLAAVEYSLKEFKAETITAYQDMAMELTMVKGLTEDAVKRLMVLSRQMDLRFNLVDQRFDDVDQRFTAVDQRLDTIDAHFTAVDQRLDTIDQRLDGLDQHFTSLEEKFDQVLIMVTAMAKKRGE